MEIFMTKNNLRAILAEEKIIFYNSDPRYVHALQEE